MRYFKQENWEFLQSSLLPPPQKKREKMGKRRRGKKNEAEKDKRKRRKRRNTSRKKTKIHGLDKRSFGHFSEVKAQFIQGKEMFTG